MFTESISNGAWKSDTPGKQIISIFARESNLDEDRLKTIYIKKAMELNDKSNPFSDIIAIFEGFS